MADRLWWDQVVMRTEHATFHWRPQYNTNTPTHSYTLGALLYSSNSVPNVIINTQSTEASAHPCVVFVFAVIQFGRKKKRGGARFTDLLKSETLLHQQPLCSPSPGQEQISSSRRTRASVVSARALRLHFEPVSQRMQQHRGLVVLRSM